jgi:hypothetical protein
MGRVERRPAIPPSDDDRQRLTDASNALLRAAQRLRDLERRKRTVDISSAEFHALADEIAAVSRDVFNRAHEEAALDDGTERQSRSIEGGVR